MFFLVFVFFKEAQHVVLIFILKMSEGKFTILDRAEMTVILQKNRVNGAFDL